MRQVTPLADIGVIGGSGFYSLLDDASPVDLDTPFGPPSGDIAVGTLGGRRVAFVPRHGVGHRFAPHRVPYRANLWALRSAGVRQILALSAVGSLRTDLPPGSLVIPDQILDRTSGRARTYLDADNEVFHVAFADPYCPVGRACGLAAAGVTGLPVTAEATMVVVNGPRFSTRAESEDFQRAGAAIIGMTGMPEAGLARELALCYTTLTLVTDLDAGIEIGSGVTQAQVFEQFAANVPRLRTLLVATIEQLPPGQTELCECARVYDDVPPPFRLP
ncbi:MAG TPA: S-methyl-5'-thioadenosine phosphorylase [Jatrophihabitantaceae bacterium]|nr:S-methyl-5'-thioadenosine phosphorylase [Jatrophihabitantaceae bacterium]